MPYIPLALLTEVGACEHALVKYKGKTPLEILPELIEMDWLFWYIGACCHRNNKHIDGIIFACRCVQAVIHFNYFVESVLFFAENDLEMNFNITSEMASTFDACLLLWDLQSLAVYSRDDIYNFSWLYSQVGRRLKQLGVSIESVKKMAIDYFEVAL